MADEPPSWRLRLRRLAVRWGLLLFLCWVAIVGLALWFENKLVYVPSRASERWVEPPVSGFEDVWLNAADGTHIHAWHLPHPDPSAGAVLISHGNGGNLSHRGGLMVQLRRHLGRSVVCYDYPGYGRSDRQPSEAGCYAAADAAYKWLTESRGVPAGKVVLFGESLGGGVAVDQASRLDHEALLLVFTFTSLPAAAKSHYPYLPCFTLMTNRFDNLAKIGKCRKPVFITHGTADVIIPFEQGEELYAAANEPKRFLRLEGGHHEMPMDDGFFRDIRRFLDEPQ